jgi:hypothetical protein
MGYRFPEKEKPRLRKKTGFVGGMRGALAPLFIVPDGQRYIIRT